MSTENQTTVETTTTETVVLETKKRGRPVVEGSVRQLKLAAREAAGGVKRGRPVSGESKRQTRLAAQEAKKAAGVDIKPGRPKGSGKPKEVKVPVAEEPTAEVVTAELV